MLVPRSRDLPLPSLKPVGFVSGMQQWQQLHGSRKKGRERQGWGSVNSCAVINTNTQYQHFVFQFFSMLIYCLQSFCFLFEVELDGDDKGPLGPVCVPGAAWPQPPQLPHGLFYCCRRGGLFFDGAEACESPAFLFGARRVPSGGLVPEGPATGSPGSS